MHGLVSSEDGAKEGTAGGEDHFVGLQLLILAGNGDIEKLLLVPEIMVVILMHSFV